MRKNRNRKGPRSEKLWFDPFETPLMCAVAAFCVLVVPACRERSTRDDSRVREFRRKAEIGKAIEEKADIVLRIVGSTDDPRLMVLKFRDVEGLTDRVLGIAEFDNTIRERSNLRGPAVVVVSATGFDLRPATNIVRFLRERGFSSVRVLAEGWGARIPVPENLAP